MQNNAIKNNYIRAIAVVALLLLLNILPVAAEINRGVIYISDDGELSQALFSPDTVFSGNAPQHIQDIANRIVGIKSNPNNAAYTSPFEEPINVAMDESAYRLRGHAYQLLGQYQKAITDYTRAVKLALQQKDGSPWLGDAYLGRGRAYEKIGKDEKAKEDYTAAVNAKVNFSRHDAYLLRGRFYQRRAQYDMAKADYIAYTAERGEDLDSSDTLTVGRHLVELAAGHMSQGQVLSATDDCYLAIKLNWVGIVLYCLLLVCIVLGIWVLWTAIATRTFGPAVAIVMLVIGMFLLPDEGEPHKYQIFVKFLVCAITSHSAYRLFQSKRTCWAWIMGSIAILYNPVFQIPLERNTSPLVNFCVIWVIGASILLQKKATKMRNDTSAQNPSGTSVTDNSILIDSAK